MQRIRSRSAGVAAMLAVALGASGCGGLGSTAATETSAAPVPELRPDQQVSIVFESYNFGLAGAWTDTFNELIGKFQQAHPNIKVTAQKPQGNSPNPVNDSASSVQAQMAAGNPPDVAQQPFSAMDYAVHGLGAQSLTDLFGRDSVQKNFDGATHPFAPTAAKLGDMDGKTYGIPFVLSTPVLYYNATLFQQAGLDPANPPKTWDEFKQDALAIKSRTGKDGGYIDCLTKTAQDWCFQSLVRSNGGRVISADHSTLSFADDPSVQAVQMAQDLVNAGASPKLSQQQGYEAFARGDEGMILESSALQGTFMKGAKDKWDLRAGTMPSFGGRPTVTTNSGAALFVFAKDPAKQRAAWELMKFLTSEEAYVTISSKIGYLPLRTGLANDPAGLAPWAAQNPLIKPNIDQLAQMEPAVPFPGNNYQQIRDAMMVAVESAVYQGAGAKSALAAAQDQATRLLPAKGGR